MNRTEILNAMMARAERHMKKAGRFYNDFIETDDLHLQMHYHEEEYREIALAYENMNALAEMGVIREEEIDILMRPMFNIYMSRRYRNDENNGREAETH